MYASMEHFLNQPYSFLPRDLLRAGRFPFSFADGICVDGPVLGEDSESEPGVMR